MCGFCGEIRFDGRAVDPATIHRMNEAQQSRGPDGSGVFVSNQIGLGHRRLSIIDLSTRSSQPMIDNELGLAIVFNGAIYNYPDLRKELQSEGYQFFSHGDTEVLLKAYHHWGEDFVHRLNGMFAFAIWERDTGRVFMARDRLGIKPLYFAHVDGGIRFASTLPAIVKAGGVDTRIDPAALHNYMTFHSVVPAPRTLLKGVRKLEPAHAMVVEKDGKTRSTRYWDLPFNTNAGLNENEWIEVLLAALRLSVKRRLIADVPVGVLLSGGLDSSLVVGLLAEAGVKDLKTFSVGFEAVNDEKGDEFEYSDIVVERFKTDHRKIFVPSDRALDELDDCIRAMSEPMVSHDNIGFFLLSQEVSKHVKVVQSGQGADEVFAGYHWYPPMLESTDPVSDYARVFFDRTHNEYSTAVLPDLVSDDYSRQFVDEHFERDGAGRPIDKTLRIDTQVMLVEDPVKRVDNATMAWGLEARVPFLDHELVELAATIPGELKTREGGKYILKQAARRIIPHGVIDRPKGYFPVPALKYLKGPYLKRVRDVLGARRNGLPDLFQKKYVNELLENPESHITPLRGSKLWQIAVLEYWLQIHQINAGV